MSESYKSYAEFVSLIKSRGLAVGSHFSVILPKLYGFDTDSVIMQCEIASLPGINIMTADIRNYGEASQVPYGVTYPPVELSFIVTNAFDVRGYFERWTNLVFDRETRTVGYYSQYVDTMQIFVQNKGGDDIYGIKLNECYPVAMNSIGLNSSDHDVMRLGVTMAYKWWTPLQTNELIYERLDPRETDPYQNNTSVEGYEVDIPNWLTDQTPSSNDIVGPFNIGSAMSTLGPNMAASFNKAGSQCVASLLSASPALTHPDVPTFGSDLADLTKTLTNKMASFGNALGDLGKSLTAVTAPASAIGGALGSAGSTLRSIDNLLSRAGIKTNLGKHGSDLGKFGGVISQASQLKGIPGALGGVGANMGSIGNEFANVSRQVANIPNASAGVTTALSKLGNVFSSSGSSTSNSSSSLSSLFGF